MLILYSSARRFSAPAMSSRRLRVLSHQSHSSTLKPSPTVSITVTNNLHRQLNIWHTCDTVILRWRTTVQPGAPQIVTGIIVLETEYDGSDYLIKTVYSEFNSGAWLVDIDVFNPVCPAPAASKSKRGLRLHAA